MGLRCTSGALLVGAMVLTAACDAELLVGPSADQGVEGVVLLGPQCPVQSLDDPCPDLPYAAWIRVRTASGAMVTRIRSGDDGRFRIGLRAGRYLLDPESGSPFPVAAQYGVMVADGVFTEVTIHFDMGIR